MDVKKLFEKYEITPDLHPNIIVTSNGNIYLDGKVDPKDKGDEIYPEGEVFDANAIDTPKKGKK